MALTGCRSLRLSDLRSQCPVDLRSVCEQPVHFLSASGLPQVNLRATSLQDCLGRSSRSGHRHPGYSLTGAGVCASCEIVLRARENDFIGQHTSSPHSALQSAHQDGSVILFGTPDRSGRGRPLLIPSTNNTHEPSPKDRTNERCDKAS